MLLSLFAMNSATAYFNATIISDTHASCWNSETDTATLIEISEILTECYDNTQQEPVQYSTGWTPGSSTYTVVGGDTFYALALAPGITVAELDAINNFGDNAIYTGQTLYLNVTDRDAAIAALGTDLYIAVTGDSLGGMAASHGISTAELRARNPQIGQWLLTGQKVYFTDYDPTNPFSREGVPADIGYIDYRFERDSYWTEKKQQAFSVAYNCLSGYDDKCYGNSVWLYKSSWTADIIEPLLKGADSEGYLNDTEWRWMVEYMSNSFDIFNLNGDDHIDEYEIWAVSVLYNQELLNTETKDKMYAKLNVKGLKEAHDDGWVGKGSSVAVYDEGKHGIQVMDTIQYVAPLANVVYLNSYNTADFSGLGDFDATNHSYGYEYGPSGHYAAWVHFNNIDDAHPDALHVIATPNASTVTEDDTRCDTVNDLYYCGSTAFVWAGGYNYTYTSGGVEIVVPYTLDGEYIFVGAYNVSGYTSAYNSPAVGSNEKLQDSYLVTDGHGIGNSRGTSFAAPKVAGSAAILLQKFPLIDAGQIKGRLLVTADRTFTGYSEAVHGQGLLDLNKALSPVL